MSDAIPPRLPDGGPRYVETPSGDFSGLIAEPWNAGSAMLFVVIVAVWAWALRGRYRQHAFLTICLPILAVGGIGGTLYHGLRLYRAFFLMDVIPIFILGVTVAVWLWIRLGPKIWHIFGVVGLIAFLMLIRQLPMPMQWAINVSYGGLALLVAMPVLFAMIRTHFRHAGWVYTAIACFAIAWLCRIADTEVRPPLLPMGTHWLWHLFGALTTASLSMYVYRIERVSLKKQTSAEADGAR